MAQKFCLQWNDFKENVHSAFGRLRDDKEFADVTLACEDGQQIEAHKVILAASSPVFEKILGETKLHPHPLVYLRGFQLQDLEPILDFLYFGEANVFSKDLESFLAIAEELKLKGLKDKTSTDVVKEENKVSSISKSIIKSNTFALKNNLEPNVENISSAVVLKDEDDDDKRSLDEKVTSMMDKSPNMVQNGRQSKWGTIVRKKAFICKVCGKEGQVGNIRNHIEANHLNGISVPCAICEKEFSTRKALQHHKSRYHRT